MTDLSEELRRLSAVGFGYDLTQADREVLRRAADAMPVEAMLSMSDRGQALAVMFTAATLAKYRLPCPCCGKPMTLAMIGDMPRQWCEDCPGVAVQNGRPPVASRIRAPDDNVVRFVFQPMTADEARDLVTDLNRATAGKAITLPATDGGEGEPA